MNLFLTQDSWTIRDYANAIFIYNAANFLRKNGLLKQKGKK